VTDPGLGAPMVEVLNRLQTVGAFFSTSTWSKRVDDPTISDFVAGNPHDMPVPGITEAIQKWAVPQTKDWYAYKPDVPSAREAAAKTLSAERGVTYTKEDVFLTPGTFGALSVVMRTILDRGDEVIYLSPPWFFYEAMIMIAGATPVRVKLAPPRFDVNLDAIAKAITPKTRAIIVNSPNNPAGTIYGPELLKDLSAILTEAAKRNGRRLFLLSDESYRKILFDGNTYRSPAEFYPDTFVLYTYGKTLLAPGQRLGYIALPPGMPDKQALRDTMFLSQVVGGWQFPNAVMQYALEDLEKLSVDIPRLQRRRDTIVSSLRGMGYETTNPDATFYICVRSPIEDDVAFSEMLAEHDVFVLPGAVFELPGWFRISVTGNEDMIERALPGFEKALAQAKG